MDSSRASQMQEIKAWLHKVFGEERVPDFEINHQTVDYLHKLSKESLQYDGHLQLITTDCIQKTAEYSAEAKRLSGILHRLQLTPESLSRGGNSSLTALTKLGMLLDVKDSSSTSYMLTLQGLEDELEKVGDETETETEELQKLARNHRRVLHQCSSLQKVLEVAKSKEAEDSQLNSKKEGETVSFLQKERHYRKEIKKMESQLSHAKLDESLFHESLVKKSEVLKDIQAQLEPLRAELESYSLLPPDLDQAKVKLAEYKFELEKLDKQFLDCIGNTMM